MCFEYDGYAEFYECRVVKAVKPHRCTECRAAIEPGETYERHAGKYDGEFSVDKMCRRCCYDRNRVVEEEWAEGCRGSEAWPPFGALVEHLIDSGMGQTAPEDVPAGFKVGDRPKEAASS